MQLKLKSYREPSGQRNCVIVDAETGMPDYWTTLYATCKLRGVGLQVSTIESQLRAILYLHLWAEMRDNLDIVERIKSAKGFSANEIDSLTSLLRSHIRDVSKAATKTSSNVVNINSSKLSRSNIWKTLADTSRQITPESYNNRLMYVGNYIKWLADYLSDDNGKASGEARDNITLVGIDFKDSLESMKSVEPSKAFENPKDLTPKEVRRLLEVVNPYSDENPFKDMAVRIRNYAIVAILLDTGLRSGELLSLKMKDVIVGKKGSRGLKVKRRQNDPTDFRKKQRVAKRGERQIPLSEGAWKALELYRQKVRYATPEAQKSEWIFVSLSNSSKGRLLGSVDSIFNAVKSITGIDVSAHKLRHTATWRYCTIKKQEGKEWPEIVETLIMKFGWVSENSPSVRLYARRYVKDKMFEASIQEQDEITDIMTEAASRFEDEGNV